MRCVLTAFFARWCGFSCTSCIITMQENVIATYCCKMINELPKSEVGIVGKHLIVILSPLLPMPTDPSSSCATWPRPFLCQLTPQLSSVNTNTPRCWILLAEPEFGQVGQKEVIRRQEERAQSGQERPQTSGQSVLPILPGAKEHGYRGNGLRRTGWPFESRSDQTFGQQMERADSR